VKICKVEELRHCSSFEQPPRELYAFVNTHFLNDASLGLSFAREYNAAWQRPVRNFHLRLS
jgi:hypothetical protein